jgi:hypothetical protein
VCPCLVCLPSLAALASARVELHSARGCDGCKRPAKGCNNNGCRRPAGLPALALGSPAYDGRASSRGSNDVNPHPPKSWPWALEHPPSLSTPHHPLVECPPHLPADHHCTASPKVTQFQTTPSSTCPAFSISPRCFSAAPSKFRHPSHWACLCLSTALHTGLWHPDTSPPLFAAHYSVFAETITVLLSTFNLVHSPHPPLCPLRGVFSTPRA